VWLLSLVFNKWLHNSNFYYFCFLTHRTTCPKVTAWWLCMTRFVMFAWACAFLRAACVYLSVLKHGSMCVCVCACVCVCVCMKGARVAIFYLLLLRNLWYVFENEWAICVLVLHALFRSRKQGSGLHLCAFIWFLVETQRVRARNCSH